MQLDQSLAKRDFDDSENLVQILDDLVVNQIAAGEVVERPASVVKELVENSLDAGSTEIVVSVRGGGRNYISVVDNGIGMSKLDALNAIKRFGTSKIRDVSDLLSIESLGFRGEALPSIAAVSRFSLETTVRGGGMGVRLKIQGGIVSEINEYSAPEGCKITIEDLFFNVPARKKFLRTEKTELSYIKLVIEDLAYAFPAVRFELLADGKSKVLFPKAENFKSRALQMLGKKTELMKISDSLEHDLGVYQLEGLLSIPTNSTSGANKLRLIVNGRAVRDKLLLRAVREGYGNTVKPGRYPVGVVKLELPARDVDINVHPQKSEVRFRAPDRVFKIIARSIKRTISDEKTGFLPDLKTRLELPEEVTKSANQLFTSNIVSSAENLNIFRPSSKREPSSKEFQPIFEGAGSSHGKLEELEQVPDQVALAGSTSAQKLSEMRYVGQIFKCYLLFEGQGVFGIVDMHAAHEIVTFVQIRERLQQGNIPTQVLISPVVSELDDRMFQTFVDSVEELSKLGLDCEVFGENSVVVRATPAPLGQINPEALLKDILSVPEWSSISIALESAWDAVVARLACHASIRSGREMKRLEAEALVESLEATNGSAFCPHGRPVVQYFSKEDLEIRFGRIQ